MTVIPQAPVSPEVPAVPVSGGPDEPLLPWFPPREQTAEDTADLPSPLVDPSDPTGQPHQEEQ
jgi:hypothetical protein